MKIAVEAAVGAGCVEAVTNGILKLAAQGAHIVVAAREVQITDVPVVFNPVIRRCSKANAASTPGRYCQNQTDQPVALSCSHTAV